MRTEPAWNALRIFRAGFLTLMSVALSALFGAVWLPLTHDFAADALIWLVLVGGLSALHFRAAYRHRRRAADKEDVEIETLAILAEVAYEVMGLIAGGFFGLLFAWVTWGEYRKSGLAGNTPWIAGLTLVLLIAFFFSLAKLVRYLRAAGDVTP